MLCTSTTINNPTTKWEKAARRGDPATTAVLETRGRRPVETEPKQSNERIRRVRIDLSGERLPQTRGLVREMHSRHRGTPVRQVGPSEEKSRLYLSLHLPSCVPPQSTSCGSVA